MAEHQDILCACGCQQVCSPGSSWISGHNFYRPSLSIPERFWPHVHKTETCWLWTGRTNKKGYGLIHVGTKMLSTHRLAYTLTYGPIPTGLWVLHRCDIPACVRPDHLWLGTHRDNMQDMHRKGRNVAKVHPELVPRGDRHGTHTRPESRTRGDRHWSRLHPERLHETHYAKLTEAQVKEIRRLYSDTPITQKALAQRFGVNDRAISAIITRKTWRHVPDD